jgi:hypothetical protein
MRSVADGRTEPPAFDRHLVLDGNEGVRSQPQHSGSGDWINSSAPPPRRFVAAAMNLAMVSSTQRHGERVADLASEGAALGKSQVMGIRGQSAADQARMLGNRSNMFPIPDGVGCLFGWIA